MKKIIAVLALLFSPAGTAAEAAWEQLLDAEYRWSRITETGSLLVSTGDSLQNINATDGNVLWRRDEMAELAPFNVSTVAGTPLLLINEHAGTIPPKTRLQVLDATTGESQWDSGVFQASNLAAIPIPSHNLVLYMADHTGGTPWGDSRKDLKPGTYVSGLKLDTGEVIFDTPLDSLRKAVRHPSDADGGWIPDMDLSGYPAPVIEDGIIYLPYTGLVAMKLDTGELLWETSFKTAIPNLKFTGSPALIAGDVIYTSGNGHILALDKKTGAVLWKTKVGRKYLIPELLLTDELVIGRIGGTFSNGKDVVQQKPFGVVALNRADGGQRWLWKKGKKGMTNMVHVADRGWVVVADRYKMYALDLAAEKKPSIAKELELEFKRAMGSAEMAAKGMTVGSGLLSGGIMGGLQGGLKALDSSSREDPPSSISIVGEDLIVRGQFHLLSYDEDTEQIEYSIAFAPPGVNGLALAAMGAMTALNAVANTGLHNSWGARNAALGNALNVSDAFAGEVSKRYAAAEQADNLAFFLTTSESGLVLMGINLDSGEQVGQIPMDEKEPKFMVDSLANIVYYMRDGKEVIAFPF